MNPWLEASNMKRPCGRLWVNRTHRLIYAELSRAWKPYRVDVRGLSHLRIARRIGVTRSYVTMCIGDLRELGALDVFEPPERRAKASKGVRKGLPLNRYRLNWGRYESPRAPRRRRAVTPRAIRRFGMTWLSTLGTPLPRKPVRPCTSYMHSADAAERAVSPGKVSLRDSRLNAALRDAMEAAGAARERAAADAEGVAR